MQVLSGSQRRYLRALAHHLNPVILVGKGGINDALVEATHEALNDHELIKVKFNDFKEERRELTTLLQERTESHVVGIVGNIAMLYRPQADPEKRTITLPQ